MPRQPEMRRLGKVPALDGLRGVAVLLVVLAHTTYLTNPFTNQVFYVGFLDRFVAGSALGVDMFFVLSGFLITAILLRERIDTGTTRFAAFYRRRALRLLPALVVLLAVHFVYAALVHLPLEQEWTTDWSAMLYVLNYHWVLHTGPIAPSLGHLWSLSVEEQFYLFWPATLVLMMTLWRRVDAVATAMIAGIVLVAANRAQMWQHLTNRAANWITVAWRTDARADALLIGALVAWLWVHGRTPKRGLGIAAWCAIACIAVILETTSTDTAFLYLGGFTLFAVAVGLVVLATVENAWSGTRALNFSPLRLVGRVSYGLYLWHFPIFWAVDKYRPHWPALEHVIVAYAVTAAFTTASFVFVERPALRWKHRLETRDATAALTDAGGSETLDEGAAR